MTVPIYRILRPADSSPTLRILIVDDNRDEADSLAVLLGFRGEHFDIRVAYSAQAALEVARQFQPHVMLLDLVLPGMSGYELADALRAEQPDVTLIAITGMVDDAYRAKARDSGFAHHFLKPVSSAKLCEALQMLGAQKAQRA